ncbi:hypothetical protein BYT27DRAFT_7248274 [Phlegmacium glaucopus]|nr:hypothetical protein BYT27DRAFT_7248274 [Phlegmacium glaucopus]
MSPVSFQAIDEPGYFSDLGHDVQPVLKFDVHLQVPYPDVHPPYKQIQHLVTLCDAVAIPFTSRCMSPAMFVPPPNHYSPGKAVERLVAAPSVHDSPAVPFASPPWPVCVAPGSHGRLAQTSSADGSKDIEVAAKAASPFLANDQVADSGSNHMEVAARAASLFLANVDGSDQIHSSCG